MNILIFDIETLPSKNPELIERLRLSIKPPGNIKKPESIKAWMDENAEEKLVELIAKTSLDGAYGSIACIAWTYADDRSINVTESTMSEPEVIMDFYNAIEDSVYITNTFCGHNVSFDLQFLKHRSIILGIKPPATLLDAMNSKPWSVLIADTMHMWTNDHNKYISLNELCNIFGIAGKDDFNGSMVADTWKVNPQKVIDYCAKDVQRTYEVFKKITFSEERSQ